MPIYWLSEDSLAFPDHSLSEPNGVMAIGGDLSPERLLMAYQLGIFPWYHPGENILWWSPDPRFVLFPDDLKVQRSMRPYFNQSKFQVTFDQHFETVMRQCADRREGTWISEEMVDGYVRLHELGYAHSLEVWEDEHLVGGLYGIALGKCFFGESMFAKVDNASKFGFITLVRRLGQLGYVLIDCQQQTRHLSRMGARAISREKFLEYLSENTEKPTHRGRWTNILEEEPPTE